MSYDKRADIIFEQRFKNNNEGHALYLPVSSKNLKPGACGYFDHDGNWKTIVHLSEPAGLNNGGWSPLSNVETVKNSIQEVWGVMLSTEVSKFEPSVEVSPGIPGIPLGAGIKVGYMINKKPITREGKFYVITKTYTTKCRRVAILQANQHAVVFGVNLNVFSELGKITPELSWWNSSQEQVWRTAQATEETEEIPVFMCGWYWRPTFLARKPDPTAKKSNQKKTLGSDDSDQPLKFVFPVSDNEEHVVLLDLEKKGKF
ncbi:hypothetical protein LTR84_003369 [Exophiala bonariae]|uniref:Uncharacterized protein n=1 Tax=Exophiala bonariae TaxID=1690606 RepID=A0AAV9N6P5_9EURO|nr:hypothetical protein LTR84_003369 [Exophiala bonariae]